MSPTKDRLNELKQVQNDDEVEITIKSTESKANDIDQTLQKAEIIRRNIETIKNNTEKASFILKNNVLKVSKNQQDELDSLIRTNTSTAHKINSILKEFEHELNKIKNKNTAEFRIKRVQYTTLKKLFQEVLKESSVTLEYHRNHRKELLKKSLQTAQKDITDEELECLLDQNQLDVFTDNHLMTTEQVRQQLSDIEARHKELLEVERQLNEVLDLFLKIATLVEQQQESVDRVEYHAETATDFIEHGTKDLEKGLQKKQKYSRRRIYIILISIIIILIIVLILIIV
ncbi:hypothetical protein ILUMI_21033 [Ignelater luminosus]|uniref:t-SNARE coiled-coil homology domain-containing protein n=1 Tax=Ignelater luminosus TaxID=2038154 RepID=A0A8K0CJP0_IGNLU|nr:hypothetical protein ILUMI_21033 [Ignelater luminosus]